MYRENEGLQDVLYQRFDGGDFIRLKSRRGNSTRRKFPAVAADLRTRWCSSAVKIDVLSRVIGNNPDYKTGRFIVCTGERREESCNRAKYQEVEKYRMMSKSREIYQWRPIIDWTEQQVWDIIKRWMVQPHPCYELGWSRCSCQCCIFSSANVWASIAKLDAGRVDRVGGIEDDFDHTLYRGMKIAQKVARGKSFVDPDSEWIEVADSKEFTKPIIVENWKLPKGAFGEEKSGSV